MIVLTRKPGEEIVIDDNIRLLIVAAPGGFVRVGIDRADAALDNRGRVNTLRGDQIDLDESPDDYVNLFPDQPKVDDTTIVLPGVCLMAKN